MNVQDRRPLLTTACSKLAEDLAKGRLPLRSFVNEQKLEIVRVEIPAVRVVRIQYPKKKGASTGFKFLLFDGSIINQDLGWCFHSAQRFENSPEAGCKEWAIQLDSPPPLLNLVSDSDVVGEVTLNGLPEDEFEVRARFPGATQTPGADVAQPCLRREVFGGVVSYCRIWAAMSCLKLQFEAYRDSGRAVKWTF